MPGRRLEYRTARPKRCIGWRRCPGRSPTDGEQHVGSLQRFCDCVGHPFRFVAGNDGHAHDGARLPSQSCERSAVRLRDRRLADLVSGCSKLVPGAKNRDSRSASDHELRSIQHGGECKCARGEPGPRRQCRRLPTKILSFAPHVLPRRRTYFEPDGATFTMRVLLHYNRARMCGHSRACEDATRSPRSHGWWVDASAAFADHLQYPGRLPFELFRVQSVAVHRTVVEGGQRLARDNVLREHATGGFRERHPLRREARDAREKAETSLAAGPSACGLMPTTRPQRSSTRASSGPPLRASSLNSRRLSGADQPPRALLRRSGRSSCSPDAGVEQVQTLPFHEVRCRRSKRNPRL